MLKRLSFFSPPKWERKKAYLKIFLEKNNLAFLKSGISLHLIKSHSPKNVKSESINFLINPFIYFSRIAFWLFFMGSRAPVLFPYLIPHIGTNTTFIHISHQKIQQVFLYCDIVVIQSYPENKLSKFQWLYLLISIRQVSHHLKIWASCHIAVVILSRWQMLCFIPITNHLSKECVGEKATCFIQGEIKHDWSIVILPGGKYICR